MTVHGLSLRLITFFAVLLENLAEAQGRYGHWMDGVHDGCESNVDNETPCAHRDHAPNRHGFGLMYV
jgi:hypothetical protein